MGDGVTEGGGGVEVSGKVGVVVDGGVGVFRAAMEARVGGVKTAVCLPQPTSQRKTAENKNGGMVL